MIASLLCLAVLESSKAISFSAVGDVMLARGVGRSVSRKGPESLLAKVRDTLKADIVFGNLECCLTEQPIAAIKRFQLRASPSSVSALNGFTHVSLSNNHAMDCGLSGLYQTRLVLSDAGIGWVDSVAPLYIGGNNVALFAFNELETPATDIVKAVRSAKTGTVIVSMHWGIEYSHEPTARQRRLAAQLAKVGADLIIGHGPHVLQPVEWEGTTLVAYSLGNFVFDDSRAEPSLTAILRCDLTKNGPKSIRLIPMAIKHCAPQPADSLQSKVIWKYLALDRSGQPKRRQHSR